ncbi:hypothetical protein DMUE_0997 [Dictyocoela muelleri]|nr:hypothetical protein DMUE_0997 [Dictyocoela muelleri]
MFDSFFPEHIRNIDNVYKPDNSVNEQKLSYLLHYIQSDTRRMQKVLRYLKSKMFAEYRATGRMETGLKILHEIMIKFSLNSMSYETEILKIIFSIIRSNAISPTFLRFCKEFFNLVEIRTYKSEVLVKRILLFVTESATFEDTSSDESILEEMNYYVSDHDTNLFFINCILQINGIFNNNFKEKFDNVLSYLMFNYNEKCVPPIIKCIKSINIVNSEYFIDRFLYYSVKYSLNIYQLLFDYLPEPGFLYILSGINKKMISEIDDYNFETLIFWGKKFSIKSNLNIPDVSTTFANLLELYLNNCCYEIQQNDDSYTTINTNKFVDLEKLYIFEKGELSKRDFLTARKNKSEVLEKMENDKNELKRYKNELKRDKNELKGGKNELKRDKNELKRGINKINTAEALDASKLNDEYISRQKIIRAFYMMKNKLLSNYRFRSIYEYFSIYVKQNPYGSEIFYFFLKGNNGLFFLFFIIDKMRYLNFKMDLNLVIVLISITEKHEIIRDLIFEIFRKFEPFFVEKAVFEKILCKFRSLFFKTNDENLYFILNKYNFIINDKYNFREDERSYEEMVRGNNYFESRKSSVSIDTLNKKRRSHICNFKIL